MVPAKPSITVRNILTQFRRCGRGILKGAAFRQRPLSRLLLNVLAGTRTLPPEGSEPKASGNLMVKQKTTFLSMQIRQHFAPASWGSRGFGKSAYVRKLLAFYGLGDAVCQTHQPLHFAGNDDLGGLTVRHLLHGLDGLQLQDAIIGGFLVQHFQGIR